MSSKFVSRGLLAIASILILVFGASCGLLSPEFSFQGRLTDAGGTPLNGSYSITFKLFDASTGGAEIYSETESVTVTDGLFETSIGPTSSLGALDPEDLTQPLYLELTIDDGTYTETLSPRQQLYGAPYAFTLMAGSVISGGLDTTLYGASNVKGVVTIQNSYEGDGSNPALPALRVIGDTGIEISDPSGVGYAGTIVSNPGSTLSELHLKPNDDLEVHLDADNNSAGYFVVRNGAGTDVCHIDESGNLTCIGSVSTSADLLVSGNSTISGTKSAVVDVNGEQRLLYAMESPEVWFEDFGSGTLENGVALIQIESLFAETVNLSDYHIFLTPLGDCNGLFIAEKTETSFSVQELGGGTSNISFDYRIVAKRLSYEDDRLELAPTPPEIKED